MKTKIFFLLAALLLNVCAFAQSGNGTLKGDVNNDGTVDVADINAVIEIMKNGGGTGEETKYYFSIGTTPVTAENYTTANNATTVIPTTMEYTSSQRTYHYILIPSNKTLTMVDKNLNLPIPMTEQTSAGINGHKLYKTNGAIASGATVVITLSDGTGEETKYYFSIGTTPVTAENYTTVNGATTTIPTTMEYSSTERNYHYILIPSTKTLTIIGKATNALIEITEQTSAGISGHKLYKTNGALSVGGTVVITLSDGTGEETKCYFSIGTNAVTASNYTTVNNATTTIPTTMEYSSTERNYHYILIPSTKTMTIIDKASGGTINITEQTSAGIGGHKLYKTNGPLNVGGTVVITLSDGTGEETKCYFSIGTNAVTASNYTTANNATTTIPTTMEYTSTERNYHYVLIPSGKTVTVIDKTSQASYTLVEQTDVSIPNHILYKTTQGIARTAVVIVNIQ